MSMRPSGRNAIRQGSSKVATGVIVKGRPGSGFCSPELTWAPTAADASTNSNAVFAKFIVMCSSLSLSLTRLSSRHRNRHGLAGAAFGDPDRIAGRLDGSRRDEPLLDHRDAGLVAVDGYNRNPAAA